MSRFISHAMIFAVMTLFPFGTAGTDDEWGIRFRCCRFISFTVDFTLDAGAGDIQWLVSGCL